MGAPWGALGAPGAPWGPFPGPRAYARVDHPPLLTPIDVDGHIVRPLGRAHCPRAGLGHPPKTGFGEHWGPGSKTMVLGPFLTLKTVLFLEKHVKLPKKKKKTPETDNQRLRPPAPGPAPVDIGARGQNGHFRPTFFPEKHKILDDGHFLWSFQKYRILRK